MRARKFFFVSLILAILAVGLQCATLNHFGRGAQTIARAVTLSRSEQTDARTEAHRFVGRGKTFVFVGILFALASAGCLVASVLNLERAWHSLTLALLIFYVMLQFTLV
jgi:hypothetical protein